MKLVELCMDVLKRRYGYGFSSKLWLMMLEKHKTVNVLMKNELVNEVLDRYKPQHEASVFFNESMEYPGVLLYIPVSIPKLRKMVKAEIRKRNNPNQRVDQLTDITVMAGGKTMDTQPEIIASFPSVREMVNDLVLPYRTLFYDQPSFIIYSRRGRGDSQLMKAIEFPKNLAAWWKDERSYIKNS